MLKYLVNFSEIKTDDDFTYDTSDEIFIIVDTREEAIKSINLKINNIFLTIKSNKQYLKNNIVKALKLAQLDNNNENYKLIEYENDIVFERDFGNQQICIYGYPIKFTNGIVTEIE